MKNSNLNFHQTFKPERKYLTALLNISNGECLGSVQDISAVTGIPTGKSSGKVLPHLYYARYMGLIEWSKDKQGFTVSLTELGKLVKKEDIGFQENLTLLLSHCMICRPANGATLWNFVFCELLPKYQNCIEKKYLGIELEKKFEEKVKFAPFEGCYKEFLEGLKLLEVSKEGIQLNYKKYYKEFIYLYGFVLLTYWKEAYPNEDEITSNQFDKMGFDKILGLNKETTGEILAQLANKDIIRLNKQLMPYTILRLTNIEALVNKLYSELI